MMRELKMERVRDLVSALRSGKYKQGRHYLRVVHEEEEREERMCILGVACDVSGLGHWGDEEIDGAGTKCFAYVTHDGGASYSALPAAVAEWYGFPAESPLVLWRGEWRELMRLNDDGMTFPQLADALERNLKELAE